MGQLLADATPEQMAMELLRRELPFMLVFDDSEKLVFYSPKLVDIEINLRCGQIFSMVRSYAEHLANSRKSH
jgi:hypothetical protein